MLGRDHPADGEGPATGPGRHRRHRPAAPPPTLGLTVAALLATLAGTAMMITPDILGTTTTTTTDRPAAASGSDGVETRNTAPGGPASGGPASGGPASDDPASDGPTPGGPASGGPAASRRKTGELAPGRRKPGGPGPGGPGPGGPGPGGPGPGASTPRAGTSIDDNRLAALADEVVTLTNVERRRNGCPGSTPNAALRTAIRRHVRELARHDGLYLSHTSDDGRTFAQRAREQGYPDPGAENVARGQHTPAEVVRGWMASPGHRANIVNCDLTAIGVGVAWGDGSLVWGQLFGRS